jgi:cobalt-zinc-cadmium efflux system outer membrane protein
MKHITSALCGLVLVAQASDPETNVVHNLSLDQALASAAASHPDLAEARANALAASGRAEQSALWPNAELLGGLEAIPFGAEDVDTSEYLVGFAQTLPIGGRLSKAREAELAVRDRLSGVTQVRWLHIAKQVRKAFATALYQERSAQLQSSVLVNAEKAAAVVGARFGAGDATRDEVARAEIEVVRAKTEARRSRVLHQQALIELMAATGHRQMTIKNLSGSLEDALEISVLEDIAGDVSSHPELRAARAGEQAASARLELAKAERVPNINVELLYRRIEALDANTFDIGLRIPLPTWNRNQGRMRAARAELDAAQNRSQATANELERRIELSRAELETSLHTARSLRTDIIPHANTIRETLGKRLAAGDISLTEFLPADRDWTLLQMIYLESLRDVMVAWAEVRSLTNLEQGMK